MTFLAHSHFRLQISYVNPFKMKYTRCPYNNIIQQYSQSHKDRFYVVRIFMNQTLELTWWNDERVVVLLQADTNTQWKTINLPIMNVPIIFWSQFQCFFPNTCCILCFINVIFRVLYDSDMNRNTTWNISIHSLLDNLMKYFK